MNLDARYWSEQAVAVARSRDRASFMRIYDHFGPRLQRYLTGLGVTNARAEELVQEAMLRLWRRAELYDPRRASLATWLYRIARNLYIDEIRAEPQWLPIEEALEALDVQAAAGGSSPAELDAEHSGLALAIASLTGPQARLLRMSYFEAKSHGEIARELEMPLGSVKSTLRRAFARLKAAMRERP